MRARSLAELQRPPSTLSGRLRSDGLALGSTSLPCHITPSSAHSERSSPAPLALLLGFPCQLRSTHSGPPAGSGACSVSVTVEAICSSNGGGSVDLAGAGGR